MLASAAWLPHDARAGAGSGGRWGAGAGGSLLGGAGEGLGDLEESETELEEGACEKCVLGDGEIAGGFVAEDGEHVDRLLGAENVDLGLLALLGASAELQDGLHVDGLDERLEGKGRVDGRRRDSRRALRFRGGRRWPGKRGGTAPSARLWGRGAVRGRVRRWADRARLRLRGLARGDALWNLTDRFGGDGLRCAALDRLGCAGWLGDELARALGSGIGVGTGFAFGGELAAIGDDERKRFLGHGQARFRRLGSRKVEGECCWSNGSALVLDAGVAIECFAADVAKGELCGVSVEIKMGHAGQLADGFVGCAGFEEGGSGRRRDTGEDEAGKGAVQIAAGADALDDLLAEIAAFAEVEGAGGRTGWRGFLGEVAFANVGAEERCAFGDAELVESVGVGASRAVGGEVFAVRVVMVAGSAQSSKRGTRGTVGVDEGD